MPEVQIPVGTDSSLRFRLYSLYYNLGCVLQQQGKLTAAADSYRQAIGLQSNVSRIESHSFPVYKDNHTEAVSPKDGDACDRPSFAFDIKAHSNLGCILIQQERWQEAIQVYRQAIQLQPDQAALYSNLGRALFHQDPVAAIAAYRRAVELQPTFALGYHNLGLALQHQGEHAAAVECFERTLQLGAPPTVQGDLAVSWLALGNVPRMLAQLRTAVQRDAAFIQAYCDAVRSDSADQLMQAKAACGQFLMALLQQADDATTTKYLAQTYLCWANVLATYGGDEQQQRAATYYQRTLQIQPDSIVFFPALIQDLTQQQQIDAAVAMAEAALQLYPNHPQLYSKLGYVREQQQQFELAIACYQKALALQTQSGQALEHRNGSRASQQTTSALHSEPGRASNPVWAQSPVQPAATTDSPKWLQGFYSSTQDWLAAHDLADRYIAISKTADPALPPQPNAASASANLDEACAGLNCVGCLKQIWQWFNPVHLGDGLHRCDEQATVPVAAPPLFVATIPQGRAWTVPQQNAWMVCNAVAVTTPDHYLLADLSRSYPERLPGCQTFNPNRHRIFSQSSPPPLKTITGSVAVLSGLSGNTYFHWMVDVLPRIELLRRSGLDLQQINWFLVNSTQYSFQRETLHQLGIPAEKILASDDYPYLEATQLIVPSFPGHFGWLEPWALAFLRQSFLPLAQNVFSESESDRSGEISSNIPAGISLPQRIYISRSNANHRRVFNEAEVLDHLRPLGFVAVNLESLSFEQQVALFAHAEVIVAPHGSGLTNIAFCRPDTVVVELVSPHYNRHYFWVISHLLHLQHYFVLGEAVSCAPIRELMYQNPLIEDIWVNLHSLSTMLQHLNLKPLNPSLV